MKELTIPIDAAGRLVLQKEVRQQLAIHSGDLLKVTVTGNEVSLRRKAEKSRFIRKGRALVFSAPEAEVKRETVQAVLGDARDESTERVFGLLKTHKGKA
jgi:AbrB family looped-hinge helix DNA binding protein